MKKPITDEKFYITDIPKDKEKIRELIVFLGDKNWRDSQYEYASNSRFIIYDRSISDYGYGNSISPKNYHTVITYNDLMANYLPKDTVLNNVVDEVIKEVSKNEDKPNKVKNPNAKHYELWKSFEAIDVIKLALTDEEYKGFLKGNILKYRLRAGKKNIENDNIIKDINKSIDYQNELNEILGYINVQ